MFISINTLNVSVILTRICPQTKLKAPHQVTEFIKSIGRYPHRILISFEGGFTLLKSTINLQSC